MKITGNTVFISGGSAGIGFAIAEKLSGTGNRVIINGRNGGRLQEAVKKLGGNVAALEGDISRFEERIRLADLLKKDYPETNMIINNAGLGYAYLLGANAHAYEKARDEMNTNYLSVIHFTELLLPHLLGKECSAIVNMSSIAAFGTDKHVPTYCATKAALHSYTTSLRDSLKDKSNLQIYEVFPPLVNTRFSADIGGETGISPSEVADELFSALEDDRLNVPVGETKRFFKTSKQSEG